MKNYLGLHPRLRGTLSRVWDFADCFQAYPRACGEHSLWLKKAARMCGLPPRLRGTQAGGQVR